MESGNEKKKSIKRFLPGFFLAALTLALMFYFKENRGNFDEIVEKGKSDLVSLYTENLQPLLFGTDLTNEDVFNFAFYQTLPIDKDQNDVLRLQEQEDGSVYYQVIPASYKKETENYEKFLTLMNFTKTEEAKLDSILESYKPELAEAVLINNEQETVAVSSRLSSLQKAMLTDIAAFSRDANKPKMSDIFRGSYTMLDSKQTQKLISDIKDDTSREYLVLAKDTAFTSRIEFDTKELEERLEKLKSNLSTPTEAEKRINIKIAEALKLPPPPKVKRINPVKYDSSYSYTYVMPEVDFDAMNISKTAMDSLRVSLKDLEKNLANMSFSIKLDNDFENSAISDSSISFEVNLEGLGEIISKSVEGALKHKNDEKYWEEFGARMESLAVKMEKFHEDSLKKLEQSKKRREKNK